jgi:hypothetical protein
MGCVPSTNNPQQYHTLQDRYYYYYYYFTGSGPCLTALLRATLGS